MAAPGASTRHDGVVILVPPSEGKAPGGGAPGWRPGSGRFGRKLRAQRVAVAEALAAAGGGDQRLLGVTGTHLERARDANRSLVGAPTLPAWERFTGVVWDHFDVASLDAPARTRASTRVLVFSALAGLSALDDPLPDFRLKLSVGLAPLGRLAGSWQPLVTGALSMWADGAVVVDLLPGEHAAATDPGAHDGEWLRVDLVDARGRKVGHDAKAAKGLLIRELVASPTAKAAVSLLHGFSARGLRATVHQQH